MGRNVQNDLWLYKRQIPVMAMFPFIPDWPHLHPLVVHFPIAILLVVPIFILIGIFRSPQSSTPYMVSGLFLMAVGTIGSVLAVQTGHAARSQTHTTFELSQLVQQHQTLAETTSLTFCVLTVVFTAIVVIPRLMSHQSTRVITAVLPAVFLLLYAAGAVLLVNTAHVGGCMVHQFGITAATPDSHPEVTVAAQ